MQEKDTETADDGGTGAIELQRLIPRVGSGSNEVSNPSNGREGTRNGTNRNKENDLERGDLNLGENGRNPDTLAPNSDETDGSSTDICDQKYPLHAAARRGDLVRINQILAEENHKDVNLKDGSGSTALHIAAMAHHARGNPQDTTSVSDRIECIKALLRKGAALYAVKKIERNKSISTLWAVLKNTPGPIKLLEGIFDEKIQNVNTTDDGGGVDNSSIVDGERQIQIDFSNICPDDEKGQVDILYDLLENKGINRDVRRRIFKHPLLRSFVRQKWLSLRKFFYIYVTLYFVHVLSISTFVILAYCEVFYLFGIGWRHKTAQHGMFISRAILIFTSVIMTMNYVGLGYILKRRYFLSWEWIRNLSSCILAAIVSYMTVIDEQAANSEAKMSISGTLSELETANFEDTMSYSSTESHYRHTLDALNIVKSDYITKSKVLESAPAMNTPQWVTDVTTLAIFMSWFEMMLLMGRFPRWASQALLFEPVFKNVCKILVAYGCMIIAFALVFFLQFRTIDPTSFGDPWRAFVKTVVMMMGEFEYKDLFSNNEESSKTWSASHLPFLSRIVFLCFVIIASLTLMNLMQGLAVSDTSSMIAKSSEMQLMHLAESVVHWGYFIEWMPDVLKRFMIVIHLLPKKLDTKMIYSLKSKRFPSPLKRDIKLIAQRNYKNTTESRGNSSGGTVDLQHLASEMYKFLDAFKELMEAENADDVDMAEPLRTGTSFYDVVVNLTRRSNSQR